MNKSIILLSGGLDSLVSLGLVKDKLNIELALTFDYGQKSKEKEIDAAKEIAKFYNLKLEVIKLDFLKNITKTSLVSTDKIPNFEKINNKEETAKAVWVPNRNGLFLNIAGSYADADKYTHIIIGANKEEAQTFSDNTESFIDSINKELETSTQNHPTVVAPLINYNKNDIVKLALDYKIPLELTMSCYDSTYGHCGKCESCQRLYRALEHNKDTYYKKVLFKNE